MLHYSKERNYKYNYTNEPTQPDKTDVTQKLVELIMSKNQEFMTELVNNLTNSNQGCSK